MKLGDNTISVVRHRSYTFSAFDPVDSRRLRHTCPPFTFLDIPLPVTFALQPTLLILHIRS